MARDRRVKRVVVLSDLHVGSAVGLWPNRHRIAEGGELECNKYQRWLLECWRRATEEIRAMKPAPWVVLNGDPLQGVNRRDGQLVTNRIDIQADACYSLLAPIRDKAEHWYMIRGTEWHEGKAGEDVTALAHRLGAEIDEDTGEPTRWEMYLETGPGGDSPAIHFAHHVGMSSVPWYEATVPLRDALLQLAEIWRFWGQHGPNVRCVVRSHRHRYIAVDVPPDFWVVVTPGWQLKTAFAHKRAASMLPEVGYVVLEVDRAGQITPRKRLFELPTPHVEVMT